LHDSTYAPNDQTKSITAFNTTRIHHEESNSNKRRRASSATESHPDTQKQLPESDKQNECIEEPSTQMVNAEARDVIARELDNNAHLSMQRRAVLESALSLIEKMSTGTVNDVESDPIIQVIESHELHHLFDPPPIEFLYTLVEGMMFSGSFK
jgi:hypothetical protein